MDLDRTKYNPEFEVKESSVNTGIDKKLNPKLYDTIEDFFKNNYQGNWKFVKYKGRTSIISGGQILGVGTSEIELLNLSKTIGQYFSIPAEQLPHIIMVSSTANARHYYSPQVIDGIQVYNAGIQLSVDLNTNSVYQINSTLRNLKSIDESIHVDQIHAWEIVTSNFTDSVTKIDSSFKPVLYSEYSLTGAEYAWVFKVKVHSNISEQRTIVIGAATGFILVNSKLVVH